MPKGLGERLERRAWAFLGWILNLAAQWLTWVSVRNSIIMAATRKHWKISKHLKKVKWKLWNGKLSFFTGNSDHFSLNCRSNWYHVGDIHADTQGSGTTPCLAWPVPCTTPLGHQQLHTSAIPLKPSRAVWVYSKWVTAPSTSSVIFIFVHGFFCLHLTDVGKVFSSWLCSSCEV